MPASPSSSRPNPYPIHVALRLQWLSHCNLPTPYLSTSFQYLIHLSSAFDTTMSSTPTPDTLTSILTRLADRLDSLEGRLNRIEASAGPTIAATHLSVQENTKSPPFQSAKATKGKGQANTPKAPLKAKPAKKEHPTGKAANLPNPVPLHLAQTFPMEGKTDCHLITVVISDASAQHIVGQGRKGLKHIHNISGAQVNTYSMASGSNNERHISIRGTNLQISDTLIILGKWITRKKVRPPKTKTGSKDLSTPAPLLPIQQTSSSLPHFSSTQQKGPSTEPHIVEVPTGEPDTSSITPATPTVVMASPSPASTPIVPSVTMGSPTSYESPGMLTPMQVNTIFAQVGFTNPPTDLHVHALAAQSLVSSGYATVPSVRGHATRLNAPGLDPLEEGAEGKIF